MGYRAQATGKIILKEDAPVDEIVKTLGKVFPDVYQYEGLPPRLEITLNDSYHEEAIMEALKKIEKWTLSGKINYIGEEGDVWRHIFKIKEQDAKWTQEWIEERGTVYYLSEDEQYFLNELIRREIRNTDGFTTKEMKALRGFLNALLLHFEEA